MPRAAIISSSSRWRRPSSCGAATEKAVLYNDTYAVQGLDSLSPKPRGKNGSAK